MYGGKGIAQEASRIWLRFGFETLRLDEVVSFTARVNWRSERVMQKLGMTRDASEVFDRRGTCIEPACFVSSLKGKLSGASAWLRH
ncbi:GNAT family N-acetyltransferase [Pseudovibrio sp. Ad37]|uniref:GNAT family N-acetyltransferase n=1 Tax=Pseudovibrio sp. Ad37 TaxID=989422 RepID=UPI001AD8B762